MGLDEWQAEDDPAGLDATQMAARSGSGAVLERHSEQIDITAYDP